MWILLHNNNININVFISGATLVRGINEYIKIINWFPTLYIIFIIAPSVLISYILDNYIGTYICR